MDTPERTIMTDKAAPVHEHGAACGMNVTLDAGRPSAEHGGVVYHFCSQKCHDKFVASPDRYMANRPAVQDVPKGAKWTCPMHPEIIRDTPGECPKCGMALEPMGVPTADDGPNPELVDFTRRQVVHQSLWLVSSTKR